MKKELGGRVARTRAAMDALDPGLRVAMEGFRPGAYLRLRFAGKSWLRSGFVILLMWHLDT